MLAISQFQWFVPQNGYEAVDAAKGRAIVAGTWLDWITGMPARWYAPLREEPSLFKNFASLNPTENEFLAFANKYGWLGRGTATHGNVKSNESIDLWEFHHFKLRRAVALWEMSRRGDFKGLKKFLEWYPGNENGFPAGWHYDDQPYGTGRIPDLPGIPYREDDVFTPAVVRLQSMVNEKLEENSCPGIVHSSEGGRPSLQIIPKNLLGAMWLQLAAAMAGSKEYRACADCGKWFEISRDGRAGRGGTMRKLYCNSACKLRDFRRKKAEKITAKQTKSKRKK